jgi:rod shape-determining protein MreC
VVVYQQGNRRRSILVLIIITAVALITLDVRESGPISGLRDTVRDVVEPITSVVGSVFDPIGDYVDGVVHSASLKDENAELRDRLDRQRGKLAEAEAAIAENRELQQLLDLPTIEDEDAVTAQIVGGAPGNFEFTVQIDAGTSRGVQPDLAVVNAAGLAGKVADASGSQASVLLLTDPDSSVRATLANGATGFVVGRGEGKLLKLTDIDANVEVKKGDVVSTSGEAGSVFPSGVWIGTVESVESKRGALEQEITVKPAVDFSRLTRVKVLPAPSRSP